MSKSGLPVFDGTAPEHVAAYDELPLWSAMAGLLLLEHVPLGAKRALDVGCGTGFPLLELAERLGPRAFTCGVDVWGAALERAQQKARTWPVPQVAFARADGAALPFKDGAFDLVVSNLGLNNFAQPDAALREARRVLAPGGALALTTNLAGHMRELYAAFEAALVERGDAAALERLRVHVAHRGTVESLSALVARCGFRVEAVHTREVAMRFASAGALFAHHFMRLGFVAGWEAIAGEAGRNETLSALSARLDAVVQENGELRLTVPLACLVAEPV